MNVGNQSTLNDLKAVKEKSESDILSTKSFLLGEIEKAKAIKVEGAEQIQGGHIYTGSIHDLKPSGIYSYSGIHMPDAPKSLHIRNDGIMVHMDGQNSTQGMSLCMGWGGYAYLVQSNQPTQSLSGDSSVNDIVEFLTKKNTIIDANGFIKTA